MRQAHPGSGSRARRRPRGSSGSLRASFVRGLCLCLCLCLAGPDARADDVDVRLEGQKPAGERPRLVLLVRRALALATLSIAADGRRHELREGPAGADGQIVFELPHEGLGKRAWQGTLSVRFADGSEGSMPLAFETTVLAPPTLTLLSDRREIVERNRVAVSLDRPAVKVDVEVFGDGGRLLASTSKAFDGAPPGDRLEVAFAPRSDAPPLRVKVTAWDTNGMFITNESFPWQVSIPHEEVAFESGQATLRPEEEPKLRAALEALEREVTRYGRAVKLANKQIRLFVIGHTDTVGPRADNAALSLARAQAIARWFKRAGVQLPIYVRGLGEDAPKVRTPDETDEPRNRRADYFLAIDPPFGELGEWSLQAVQR